MSAEENTVERRLSVLEASFSASEARAEIRAKREIRIEEKLDHLIAENSERRGKEHAEQAAIEQDAKDRQSRNSWIQHFMPTSIFVGIWYAILWLVERFTNGP